MHAEVSCQLARGREVVQDEALLHLLWVSHLQPTHAHAIALLLSGGCLDAVKSCCFFLVFLFLNVLV